MALFRKKKILHVPTSLFGILVWLLAAVFLTSVFVAVDRDSHSISDTLYGIFPYFVSTFLLVEWFAQNTSD